MSAQREDFYGLHSFENRDIDAGERVPREKITAARDSITDIIKRLKQERVILLQQ